MPSKAGSGINILYLLTGPIRRQKVSGVCNIQMQLVARSRRSGPTEFISRRTCGLAAADGGVKSIAYYY